MAVAPGVNVLVLNAGSSSLKYSLWTPDGRVAAEGGMDRLTSMASALDRVFEELGPVRPDAIGHRVVHGGARFTMPVRVTDEVEQGIDALSRLAPLHNPHNLEGIRAARRRLPEVPQVAVFDTAFHHTLPARAYTYAIPFDLAEEHGIRRYGFHGISHRYVSGRFAEITGRPLPELRLITCHLGNGCSMCAIDRGISVDTSMGMTPLEGLIMGTRSGDLDPGAIPHLFAAHAVAPADLSRLLNSKSGLLGISGLSNDMRDLLRAAAGGHARAGLAVEAFCYRARKYLGAYLAALNGADALIFTGGIGENAPEIRARICADLDRLGITVDDAANAEKARPERQIGFDRTAVWVVPTREDLLIAQETIACLIPRRA